MALVVWFQRKPDMLLKCVWNQEFKGSVLNGLADLMTGWQTIETGYFKTFFF